MWLFVVSPSHYFEKCVRSCSPRRISVKIAFNLYSMTHSPHERFVPFRRASLLTTRARPHRHTTFQCESLCVTSVGADLEVTVKYPKTCPPRLMTFPGTAHRRFAASTWCGLQPCAISHRSAANFSISVADTCLRMNCILSADSDHRRKRATNFRRTNIIGLVVIVSFLYRARGLAHRGYMPDMG
jgi:hypothetical protein